MVLCSRQELDQHSCLMLEAHRQAAGGGSRRVLYTVSADQVMQHPGTGFLSTVAMDSPSPQDSAAVGPAAMPRASLLRSEACGGHFCEDRRGAVEAQGRVLWGHGGARRGRLQMRRHLRPRPGPAGGPPPLPPHGHTELHGASAAALIGSHWQGGGRVSGKSRRGRRRRARTGSGSCCRPTWGTRG